MDCLLVILTRAHQRTGTQPLICVSQGTALCLAHQRGLLTGWGMTHYINEALDGREHVLIISVSLDSV